jgi:hypothetical protein
MAGSSDARRGPASRASALSVLLVLSSHAFGTAWAKTWTLTAGGDAVTQMVASNDPATQAVSVSQSCSRCASFPFCGTRTVGTPINGALMTSEGKKGSRVVTLGTVGLGREQTFRCCVVCWVCWNPPSPRGFPLEGDANADRALTSTLDQGPVSPPSETEKQTTQEDKE